jgi:hypothetical protein
MITTTTPGRFAALPNEQTLALIATVQDVPGRFHGVPARQPQPVGS